jgi:hypothetical protein
MDLASGPATSTYWSTQICSRYSAPPKNPTVFLSFIFLSLNTVSKCPIPRHSSYLHANHILDLPPIQLLLAQPLQLRIAKRPNVRIFPSSVGG